MFCSNCGVKASGNFCASCGHKLQQPESTPPEPKDEVLEPIFDADSLQYGPVCSGPCVGTGSSAAIVRGDSLSKAKEES